MGLLAIGVIMILGAPLIYLVSTFFKNLSSENENRKLYLILLPIMSFIWFVFFIYNGIDFVNYIRHDIYDVVNSWKLADMISVGSIAFASIIPTVMINTLVSYNDNQQFKIEEQ